MLSPERTTACHHLWMTGLGATSLAAAIAIAGATATTSAADRSGAGSQKPGASASQSSVLRADAARRALRTAARRVGGGTAYEIETDRLSGRRVWEVDIARGTSLNYEVHVSADGRSALRVRRKPRIDLDVRRAASARVSLSTAIATASRRVPRTTFDEAGIDRERGRIVWEATFKRSPRAEVEVAVDARTGRVTRVEDDD